MKQRSMGIGGAAVAIVPRERIEQSILFMRGHKVMLDSALAKLYGVATKRLNEAVKRNLKRFPEDFMFRLTAEEVEILRSQSATSSGRHGGRRSTPYAFTENGVAMLSSILNSERAIFVNIEIMRTFTRLRQLLASHADLLRRLDAMQRGYDSQFRQVFDAIRGLMTEREREPKPRIGFDTERVDHA